MTNPLSRLLAALGRPPREVIPPRRTAVPRIELLENRLVPSTIAGVVYNDASNAGVYQPGDPVYANNPISLLNASGAVIATTVTDANGKYSFSVDQTVSTAPATQEQDLAFGPNSTDAPQSLQINQFDPSLGTLTGVDIVQDATLSTRIQVDNLDPVESTVEGQIQGTVTLQAPGVGPLATAVKADETANVPVGDGSVNFTGPGAYDFGSKDATGTTSVSLTASGNNLSGFIGTGKATLTESASADVCVCGPGNLLSLVRSVASGKVKVVYHYTPSNALKPGQYTVVQTANPPGTTDGRNTSDGAPVPPGTPADHIPVTLPPGGDSLHNDFGEVTAAQVSGYVYLDNNRDGQFDPGDAPIPGATVTLSGPTADGVGVISETTTTDANGAYSFTVPAGDYTITQPAVSGLIRDASTVGNLGGTAAPGSLTVNLPAGADGVNYDFGYVVPPDEVPLPPPLPPLVPSPPGPPPGSPQGPPISKLDFFGSTMWMWGF